MNRCALHPLPRFAAQNRLFVHANQTFENQNQQHCEPMAIAAKADTKEYPDRQKIYKMLAVRRRVAPFARTLTFP
jgi:hypothetical protein